MVPKTLRPEMSDFSESNAASNLVFCVSAPYVMSSPRMPRGNSLSYFRIAVNQERLFSRARRAILKDVSP